MKEKKKFFKTIFDLASEAASDQKEVKNIAEKAKNKLSQHAFALKEVTQDLQPLIRMTLAWARGEYKGMPLQTVVTTLAALIYFLNPFDLVHDYLPGVGFLDDLAILSFALRSLKKEIGEFLVWEKHSKP